MLQNNLKISLVVMVLALLLSFQSNAQQALEWNDWKDGIRLAQQTKKPILINVYTRGCGWCSHMEKTTFKDAEVNDYIQEHFIPIKLNIQESKAIKYKSKDYNLIVKGERKYHELAVNLLGGRYGTPGIIFLDNNLEVLQSLIGYKDSDNFMQIIQYYGEDYHKKIPWHRYLKYNTKE